MFRVVFSSSHLFSRYFVHRSFIGLLPFETMSFNIDFLVGSFSGYFAFRSSDSKSVFSPFHLLLSAGSKRRVIDSFNMSLRLARFVIRWVAPFIRRYSLGKCFNLSFLEFRNFDVAEVSALSHRISRPGDRSIETGLSNASVTLAASAMLIRENVGNFADQ